MNSQTAPPQSTDDRQQIDWLALARARGRFALIVAGAVAALVGIAGLIYITFGQPTRTVASLEFRPTFTGANEGFYPNGLPFSPQDLIAAPIIDKVFDALNISDPCSRESFREGFFVDQRSDQSVFLDLEYQARLSEPRITMVERKSLQEEHAAKRRALPIQFRLVFLAPPACSTVPSVVISKALVDVLSTWATESEEKRGVLKHQVEVLTPSALDVQVNGPGGLLLRADLLRTALQRVIQNVEKVAELPGAALIRLDPDRLSFKEIQDKLVDLVGSQLDPLVMTSGRSMMGESSLWVSEMVAAAERKQHAAEQRVRDYQAALQAYSGAPGPIGPRNATVVPGAQGPTSQPVQVPTLDDSFIDRIIVMSELNVRYRQKLTDEMIISQLEAVHEQERAAYYKRLLQRLGGAGDDADEEELAGRLESIVTGGKKLTGQFNKLYDEYSRVALRSSGALYDARKPVTIETTRPYTRRSVLTVSLIAFIGTLVLTFGYFAVRSRMSMERR